MKTKLFIGIDVSKIWIDVTIFDILKKESPIHKQFDNNEPGYRKMIKWIQKNYPTKDSELLFCLEHTGTYSFNLSKYLTDNTYFTWIENPLQIKRSMGIKRAKNDKIDSLEIAKYAFRFQDKAKNYEMPSDQIIEIQKLESFRKRLVKTKVALSVASNEMGNSELDMFVKTNTQSITEQVDKKIKEVEQKIKEIIKSDSLLEKQYKLCVSVPGVGPQTAIYLIIYTRGFTSFSTTRQLASYCGVAPFEQSSGTSVKTRPRVSNLANKRLKSLLNSGAISLLEHNSEIKQLYDRKLKEGKHHNCIVNIIRYKILDRVMAVIKRDSPFMPADNYKEYQAKKKAA